ncbi:hypothetical protein CDAR_164931 [Caerostris darwini]|uniref:Uncharacterized protein n=1 Tax=Caerostris darwini TaxID=1538125 RepID=A0AAV4VY96_9ARAC|nr:hypothetical protein CDAR_164931 [Caerostris darwini]
MYGKLLRLTPDIIGRLQVVPLTSKLIETSRSPIVDLQVDTLNSWACGLDLAAGYIMWNKTPPRTTSRRKQTYKSLKSFEISIDYQNTGLSDTQTR